MAQYFGVVDGAMNMKTCPSCGATAMVHNARDLPYTYKGETTTLPAVTGEFCTVCDESILDAAQFRRRIQMMLTFSKRANVAIVDPAFIVSVRKTLELNQREAAELFGCGVNAFSYCENGKAKPLLPLGCASSEFFHINILEVSGRIIDVRQ